nr:MAG TPA_asm: hypothetical protein [Caudoviricetes sp.]
MDEGGTHILFIIFFSLLAPIGINKKNPISRILYFIYNLLLFALYNQLFFHILPF